MATFDLSLFLANPTLSKLNFYCKNDLFEVANYFSLMVPDQVAMELLVLPVPPESAVPETATGSDETASHKREDLPPDATRLSGEVEGLKHCSLCPAMTRSRLLAQAEELKTQKVTFISTTPANTSMSSSTSAPPKEFEINKHIALVLTFHGTAVDSYFNTSEKIASCLHWPCKYWPLLIHCKVFGKAQETVAALPVEDSLDSNLVKAAILCAYELVPEACQQTFKNLRKNSSCFPATRFPEAIPLQKITASSVVKALTKLFSMFGLPRVICTD